ncbi:hypothetical protein Tco_0456027 [Tanacetum coccineum]
MKMEHYLAHIDYPVWEVIQNGNGPVSISTYTQGQIKILPPKSAEEILARERERKARTTLLMALPKDHLARLHNISYAKEMWDAIKTRFGRNAKNTGYKGRDQRAGKQEQPKALLTIDAGVINWSGQAEEEEEDHALMAFNSNSSSNEMTARDKVGHGYGNQLNKGVLSYENKVFQSVFVSRTSETENSPVNDRYAEGMHVVPSMTGILHPFWTDKEIADSTFTYGPQNRSNLVEYDARSSDFNSCESNCSEETHESMPEPVVNKLKVLNSPCFMVKSWLVQDQTVLGKDYSNLLIADSLLKTIWFINAPCYGNEALASPKANELTIPEQTATGKGKSNPFMAGSLPKTTKPTYVKTASTPIETQKPLFKDEEASDVDVHLYRSMIGSLMYLTASRLDIMFAVCACSRFQVNPKTSYLSAVKRIFRYLKGKPKLGLWYPRVSSFDLKAYSDSYYAGANIDRKSTTGGCQFLGRRLISWQCKKQTIVATSTTEAEYVAAANCCGQVLWIQNQMLDYGFNS